MEEFLSQKGISYEFRNVVTDPVTPDELWSLVHDKQGRQVGPVTRVGTFTIMGFDRSRTEERLQTWPLARTAGVDVYGRPEDPSTRSMLELFAQGRVPVRFRNVNEQPLSVERLWELVEQSDHNVKAPFTIVDSRVILGDDFDRLGEALATARAAIS